MTDSNRVLPVAASSFCGLGLLGLWLPIVQVVGGPYPTLIDLPVVGRVLAVLFVLIALLPATDAVVGRIRLTPLLLLPAVPATAFLLVVAWGAATVGDLHEVLDQLLPTVDLVVDVGLGGYLLVLADLGILVLSITSLVVIRLGRSRPAPLPEPVRPTSSPGDEFL